LDIEVTTAPTKEEMDTIRNGIHAYNRQYIGEPAVKEDLRFSVLARDGHGTITGGINAVSFWGWLHIEILWVEEALRGTGLGSRLLFSAEEFALKHEFFNSRLETTDFQAKGFYERHGYKVYGVLEDFPEDYNLYYMTKSLK